MSSTNTSRSKRGGSKCERLGTNHWHTSSTYAAGAVSRTDQAQPYHNVSATRIPQIHMDPDPCLRYQLSNLPTFCLVINALQTRWTTWRPLPPLEAYVHAQQLQKPLFSLIKQHDQGPSIYTHTHTHTQRTPHIQTPGDQSVLPIIPALALLPSSPLSSFHLSATPTKILPQQEPAWPPVSRLSCASCPTHQPASQVKPATGNTYGKRT